MLVEMGKGRMGMVRLDLLRPDKGASRDWSCWVGIRRSGAVSGSARLTGVKGIRLSMESGSGTVNRSRV